MDFDRFISAVGLFFLAPTVVILLVVLFVKGML